MPGPLFTRRDFLFSALAARGALSQPVQLPTFADVTARSGVKFKNDASLTSQKYLLESMCGGVAILDYDGDGWLDLFFVNGAALADPMPPDKGPDKSDQQLYRLPQLTYADDHPGNKIPALRFAFEVTPPPLPTIARNR